MNVGDLTEYPGPAQESAQLTHVDTSGSARMVDVGAKVESERVAVAQGIVHMAPATLTAIKAGDAPKGDAGRNCRR